MIRLQKPVIIVSQIIDLFIPSYRNTILSVVLVLLIVHLFRVSDFVKFRVLNRARFNLSIPDFNSGKKLKFLTLRSGCGVAIIIQKKIEYNLL